MFHCTPYSCNFPEMCTPDCVVKLINSSQIPWYLLTLEHEQVWDFETIYKMKQYCLQQQLWVDKKKGHPVWTRNQTLSFSYIFVLPFIMVQNVLYKEYSSQSRNTLERRSKQHFMVALLGQRTHKKHPHQIKFETLLGFIFQGKNEFQSSLTIKGFDSYVDNRLRQLH